jgi:mannitol/fructose-specific phosphotransferase system IIA component (Ntr-type)
MRLVEILKPQNIKIPLDSKAKNDAIAELVQLLAGHGDVSNGAQVLEAVLDRESTRTTGIGNGLAIPHGKTTACPGLVMAIGRTAHPIEFGSIDGRPVSIIWLVSSPPDKTGPHIHALARISKLMMIDKFRQSLNLAKDGQEFFNIVAEQEAKL